MVRTTTMGKRQRLDTSSTKLRNNRKSNETGDEVDSDYASQSSGYSETLRPKKPQDRKKRRLQSDQPAMFPKLNEKSGGDIGHIHSRSSHDIQSSSLVRLALLRWYAGVHASRGMPWRKPYDPSQGPEERAQRAYEVGFTSKYLEICLTR